MADKLNAFNEKLAVWVVKHVGSMWAFWLCFVYAPIAILVPNKEYRDLLLFASSAWAQLWLLPAIMVGQSVTGRKSELRAEEDHETLMAELLELKDLHLEMHKIIKKLDCDDTQN